MNEKIINAWINGACDLPEFFERLELRNQYKESIENYPPQKVDQFFNMHHRLPESPIRTACGFFYG